MLTTFIVAWVTNDFGDILSFIGWIGFGPIGIVAPCLCYEVLFHEEMSRTQSLLVNGISIVGTMCSVIGSVDALVHIITKENV